ncbi:MAG: hypothetical protein D6714_13075 [Bacteroidetes bacterium]|nr:MAG: hypothetical protein D6714_13075 [Bacteroidota bacterium]
MNGQKGCRKTSLPAGDFYFDSCFIRVSHFSNLKTRLGFKVRVFVCWLILIQTEGLVFGAKAAFFD